MVVDRLPMFDDVCDDSDFGGCGGLEGVIDNDWVEGRINATMVAAKAKGWGVGTTTILLKINFFREAAFLQLPITSPAHHAPAALISSFLGGKKSLTEINLLRAILLRKCTRAAPPNSTLNPSWLPKHPY